MFCHQVNDILNEDVLSHFFWKWIEVEPGEDQQEQV